MTIGRFLSQVFWTSLLLSALYLLIGQSLIERAIESKMTSWVAKRWDGELRLNHAHYQFPHRLRLEGLRLFSGEARQSNLVLSVALIDTKFSLFRWLSGGEAFDFKITRPKIILRRNDQGLCVQEHFKKRNASQPTTSQKKPAYQFACQLHDLMVHWETNRGLIQADHLYGKLQSQRLKAGEASKVQVEFSHASGVQIKVQVTEPYHTQISARHFVIPSELDPAMPQDFQEMVQSLGLEGVFDIDLDFNRDEHLEPQSSGQVLARNLVIKSEHAPLKLISGSLELSFNKEDDLLTAQAHGLKPFYANDDEGLVSIDFISHPFGIGDAILKIHGDNLQAKPALIAGLPTGLRQGLKELQPYGFFDTDLTFNWPDRHTEAHTDIDLNFKHIKIENTPIKRSNGHVQLSGPLNELRGRLSLEDTLTGTVPWKSIETPLWITGDQIVMGHDTHPNKACVLTGANHFGILKGWSGYHHPRHPEQGLTGYLPFDHLNLNHFLTAIGQPAKEKLGRISGHLKLGQSEKDALATLNISSLSDAHVSLRNDKLAYLNILKLKIGDRDRDRGLITEGKGEVMFFEDKATINLELEGSPLDFNIHGDCYYNRNIDLTVQYAPSDFFNRNLRFLWEPVKVLWRPISIITAYQVKGSLDEPILVSPSILSNPTAKDKP